jgi:hypothetical protein
MGMACVRLLLKLMFQPDLLQRLTILTMHLSFLRREEVHCCVHFFCRKADCHRACLVHCTLCCAESLHVHDLIHYLQAYPHVALPTLLFMFHGSLFTFCMSILCGAAYIFD